MIRSLGSPSSSNRAGVPSVDPSSTTIASRSTPSCAQTPLRVRSSIGHLLRVGTITVTSGRGA
jgi:hypothetical protein